MSSIPGPQEDTSSSTLFSLLTPASIPSPDSISSPSHSLPCFQATKTMKSWAVELGTVLELTKRLM